MKSLIKDITQGKVTINIERHKPEYSKALVYGDVYEGLDSFAYTGSDYFVLDNKEQYAFMCLDDRWIYGKPIINHNGYVSFEYVDGDISYHIRSSPNDDGTVTFYLS